MVDGVRSGWHRSIWEVELKGFPDGSMWVEKEKNVREDHQVLA